MLHKDKSFLALGTHIDFFFFFFPNFYLFSSFFLVFFFRENGKVELSLDQSDSQNHSSERMLNDTSFSCGCGFG